VEKIFQFKTASEIESYVRNWMAERFPEDFIESHAAEELRA